MEPCSKPQRDASTRDSGLRGVVNFQISLQKIKESDFLTRLSAMKGRSKRRRKGKGGGEGNRRMRWDVGSDCGRPLVLAGSEY